VVPALVFLSGRKSPAAERMPLGAAVKFSRAGTTYFLPASVRVDDKGAPVAMPAAPNGPGDFLALTRTDGFLELPPPAPFEPGFVAHFHRW
jgi:molybdopterin molybdotransferase